MKLPEIIGHPGKQNKNDYIDFQVHDEYNNFIDQKIVVAELNPKLPEPSGDANIYNGKDAWGEFKTDLSGLGITPHQKSNGLKVCLSTLSEITRTYNNDYGASEILPTGSLLGPKAQELMNMTGAKNSLELEANLKRLPPGIVNGALKSVTGLFNKGVNVGENLGIRAGNAMGGEFGKYVSTASAATAALARAPHSKIAWPQMWKNCSFVQSYQLNTRLYCYSTEEDDDYDNKIVAPTCALELLCTPRSDNGALYTAPYMVEFKIPGILYFPLAFISTMTVTEGGNDGDFAHTGRPNIIDISMTIQNIYSISVNVPPKGDIKYPYRPSVRKDKIGLKEGIHHGLESTAVGGKGAADPGRTDKYEDINRKDYAQNKDKIPDKPDPLSTSRNNSDIIAAAKNAAKALKDPQNNQDKKDQKKKESESESGGGQSES